MKNMQTKVLEHVEEIIDSAGYDAVKNHDWPNVGHVLAQEGFRTQVDMRFDFQSTYCTIRFTGAGVERSSFTDQPPTWRRERDEIAFYHLDYNDGARVAAMFGVLEALLPPVRKEAVR